ncbi:hypothetical protein M132_4601 [Bacteroides fragilis str. S24L15]|nr:hypothetical protein M132_4601 [Bacteroides fragilis str. S24L15]EYA74061.1 hypothetical protein M133_3869 [Bacteroides fragilis str. S24L26]EYA78670.1 hypothetical protein M134_3972 [Bacteroides fragilis str. S24L34]
MVDCRQLFNFKNKNGVMAGENKRRNPKTRLLQAIPVKK